MLAIQSFTERVETSPSNLPKLRRNFKGNIVVVDRLWAAILANSQNQQEWEVKSLNGNPFRFKGKQEPSHSF